MRYGIAFSIKDFLLPFSAHFVLWVLLFVGSSLGFGKELQYLCSPQSVSIYSVLMVWRNVLSGRKLPADVGEVLEGEGGMERSGWRLLGQAADDCFLTGERETGSCPGTGHTLLVKEPFFLYPGPPGCHASLLICSSAPSSCRTVGWQLDVTQMLCELVPECHQVWIPALLMA